MIDRYLYTIGKLLPPKNKEEITNEIKSNLYDYLEENYGKKSYTVEEEFSAMKALGHPKRLAEAYNGGPSTLIGSGYTHHYFLVLKIALMGSFIGLGLISALEEIQQPLNFFLQLINRFFQSSLSIFTVVTIIFMIIHHYFPQNESSEDEIFSLETLDLLPQSFEVVSRAELIIESVFLFFTLYLLNIGLNISETSESIHLIIPTFNLNALRPFLWIINIILLVNLLENFYLIYKSKWDKLTSLLTILTNTSIIIVIWWLFFTPDLINFMAFKEQVPVVESEYSLKVLAISTIITLMVITVINLFDIFGHIKRLIKFSKK